MRKQLHFVRDLLLFDGLIGCFMLLLMMTILLNDAELPHDPPVKRRNTSF